MEVVSQQIHCLEGLTVHIIPTVKYKTNTLVLRMKAPLSEENVTYRAILPYVLQSGTKQHPSVKSIRQYVEDLYGAALAVDVNKKKGEEHIISIYMDVANETYLQDAPPLLEKNRGDACGCFVAPRRREWCFCCINCGKRKKRALLQRIESAFDDKNALRKSTSY
ncbi:hypothetical protein GCM10020331_048900 [Ectobacillus funiculus]